VVDHVVDGDGVVVVERRGCAGLAQRGAFGIEALVALKAVDCAVQAGEAN